MSQAAPAIAAQHAQRTARAASAYRAHAARRACETAVQVHGGIGTTQERLAQDFLPALFT